MATQVVRTSSATKSTETTASRSVRPAATRLRAYRTSRSMMAGGGTRRGEHGLGEPRVGVAQLPDPVGELPQQLAPGQLTLRPQGAFHGQADRGSDQVVAIVYIAVERGVADPETGSDAGHAEVRQALGEGGLGDGPGGQRAGGAGAPAGRSHPAGAPAVRSGSPGTGGTRSRLLCASAVGPAGGVRHERAVVIRHPAARLRSCQNRA